MSGIAEVLVNLDYKVSGSDLVESETTRRLKELGCDINYGHRASNLDNPHVVVTSTAVKPDNPEVTFARENNIPVIPRAEMLAELMRLKWGLAVAGAHGKTTTTSMIAHVLGKAGHDPTAIIGGKVNAFGSNAKLGEGEFIVAEADESDGSFLKLSPVIAVVTNIDAEHLDYYDDIDDIKNCFVEFINKVPFYGLAVLCMDSRYVREVLPRIEKRYITYGFSAQADIRAEAISLNKFETGFRVVKEGEKLGNIALKMPGLHNVANALATVAVALELDVGFETIAEAMAGFTGIKRRFEIKWDKGGIVVVDDYAHHPTEIKAALAAARGGWEGHEGNTRIIAAFQPHRYSRTKDLANDFTNVFDDADKLIISDIYPAGEEPIEGITGKWLYSKVKKGGHKSVEFIPDKNEVVNYLDEMVKPGDLVITLGAGDVYKVGENLIERLERRK